MMDRGIYSEYILNTCVISFNLLFSTNIILEIDRLLLPPACYHTSATPASLRPTAWLCVTLYPTHVGQAVEHDFCTTCYERPPVLSDRFCWAAQDRFYCSKIYYFSIMLILLPLYTTNVVSVDALLCLPLMVISPVLKPWICCNHEYAQHSWGFDDTVVPPNLFNGTKWLKSINHISSNHMELQKIVSTSYFLTCQQFLKSTEVNKPSISCGLPSGSFIYVLV